MDTDIWIDRGNYWESKDVVNRTLANYRVSASNIAEIAGYTNYNRKTREQIAEEIWSKRKDKETEITDKREDALKNQIELTLQRLSLINFEDKKSKLCETVFKLMIPDIIRISVEKVKDNKELIKYGDLIMNQVDHLTEEMYTSYVNYIYALESLNNYKITKEEGAKRIKDGIDFEPIVIKWYENKKSVNIRQRGTAVAKWDTDIGGKCDGSVIKDQDDPSKDEGIIEVKTTRGEFKDIIKPENYSQCQTYMRIYQVKWCDLIIFDLDKMDGIIMTLSLDDEYWSDLYSEVKKSKELYETLHKKVINT